MNTFVIPVVTLTITALLGLFVLRNSPDDEERAPINRRSNWVYLIRGIVDPARYGPDQFYFLRY
jgi:hypothetical protein